MENEPFSVSPQKYGAQYREHVLDQYKLIVDSAEKNSDRRLEAHKYFATVNAAILTALGLTLQFGNYQSRMWARIVLAIAGLGGSLVYWMLIMAYKRLSGAKFRVITRIEKILPLALFSAEWKELGSGIDAKKHVPFSRIEAIIPIAFAVGYILLFFWCLRWLIRG